MRIHRSAYRHGIEDPDIHHAVEHASAEIGLDDERALDHAANLLEVVVVERDDESIAIHAMKMPPQCVRWPSPSPPTEKP